MDAGRHGWPKPSAVMTFENGDPDENPWVAGKPVQEDIRIENYSPEWPACFETSRRIIAEVLPGIALHIEHVGSTAVPMLAAKPVIDIDLIVSDPDREDGYIPRLTASGYVLTVRERSWYQHRMLRYGHPRINLHVFGPECPEHFRHVLFRDWLCDHPEDRARYTAAKEEAKISVANAYDYNMKKQKTVREIYHKIFVSRGWSVG
ncbi:GrpB family protein [Acetobacter fallax]|uniref:GrpB family protein n=1 Tax=Acetobacter fallax TaxID=1737473 RepID=A0ABX0KBH1_9PROT|nr:GrpB family protein [Acetobacter fallax]NHO31845.1 GrpB family protein [Acetobacter fallax]NHO35392.1 GrpB family protein [Acetobacter fallax]